MKVRFLVFLSHSILGYTIRGSTPYFDARGTSAHQIHAKSKEHQNNIYWLSYLFSKPPTWIKCNESIFQGPQTPFCEGERSPLSLSTLCFNPPPPQYSFHIWLLMAVKIWHRAELQAVGVFCSEKQEESSLQRTTVSTFLCSRAKDLKLPLEGEYLQHIHVWEIGLAAIQKKSPLNLKALW